jgi:ABC-type sugar transport system ATPase subunit
MTPGGFADADPVLLRMHNLSKRFGGVHALRSASMTIPAAGAVHGLIGENGSGKSTLLGLLSGQLSPDAGEIILDGEGRRRIRRWPTALRRSRRKSRTPLISPWPRTS